MCFTFKYQKHVNKNQLLAGFMLFRLADFITYEQFDGNQQFKNQQGHLVDFKTDLLQLTQSWLHNRNTEPITAEQKMQN